MLDFNMAGGAQRWLAALRPSTAASELVTQRARTDEVADCSKEASQDLAKVVGLLDGRDEC